MGTVVRMATEEIQLVKSTETKGIGEMKTIKKHAIKSQQLTNLKT